jgi:hypothetical protein
MANGRDVSTSVLFAPHDVIAINTMEFALPVTVKEEGWPWRGRPLGCNCCEAVAVAVCIASFCGLFAWIFWLAYKGGQ